MSTGFSKNFSFFSDPHRDPRQGPDFAHSKGASQKAQQSTPPTFFTSGGR